MHRSLCIQNPAYRFAFGALKPFLTQTHMLKQSLWLLPFVSFFAGYMIITFMLRPADIVMPSLLGKSLPEAFSLLAPYHVNARLLTYRENPDLAEGTVISQVPAPGKKIKPRQTALLTLSRKPQQTNAPALIGMSKTALEELAQKTPYSIKIYECPNCQPAGSCFAQSPSPHEPLPPQGIIAYYAQNAPRPIMWPQFIGKPLHQALEFLDRHGIEPSITISPHVSLQGPPLIIDQRPLAGTILSPDWTQPPVVQLHVQEALL